jgi:hypothetical protein
VTMWRYVDGMDRSFLLLIAVASAMTFTAVFALSGGSEPSASAAPAVAVEYADCDAVRAAGKAPLQRGQPGFRDSWDVDGDGVVCAASSTPVSQPSGAGGSSDAPPPNYQPSYQIEGAPIPVHQLG